MVTKESIDKALPKLEHVRKNFRYLGSHLLIGNNIKTLSYAVAAFHPKTGKCESITLYGYGDNIAPCHKFGTPGILDVTDLIEDWMKGAFVSRLSVVENIYKRASSEHKRSICG